MRKQPPNNRYKEQDDETIRLNNYNNFGSSNIYSGRNFKQINQNRSPSFGTSNNFQRKSRSPVLKIYLTLRMGF